MDGQRFDRLTRALAQGQSRRSVLKGLLGFGGAAAVSATALDEATARRRGQVTTPATTTPAPTTTTAPPSCDGYPCGIDCCDSELQCCDGECCPEGYTCIDEETCCPDDLICDTDPTKCCDEEGCNGGCGGSCECPAGRTCLSNGTCAVRCQDAQDCEGLGCLLRCVPEVNHDRYCGAAGDFGQCSRTEECIFGTFCTSEGICLPNC